MLTDELATANEDLEVKQEALDQVTTEKNELADDLADSQDQVNQL